MSSLTGKIAPGGKSPFLLENESEYQAWRQQKLQDYPKTIDEMTFKLNGLDDFCVQQRQAIQAMCDKTNMAFFHVDREPSKEDIQDFAFLMGLSRIDNNLCADEDAITSIRVHPGSELHKTYIPYSNKPLSWHTDGYYNTPDHTIRAFLMYCVRAAKSGGNNQFMDPEIIYILLRDDNPDSIAALMQADVMTIPANIQDGKEIRAAQTGAV